MLARLALPRPCPGTPPKAVLGRLPSHARPSRRAAVVLAASTAASARRPGVVASLGSAACPPPVAALVPRLRARAARRAALRLPCLVVCRLRSAPRRPSRACTSLGALAPCLPRASGLRVGPAALLAAAVAPAALVRSATLRASRVKAQNQLHRYELEMA